MLEVGAFIGTLPPFSPNSWHLCGAFVIGKPYALLLAGSCDNSEVGVSFEGNSSMLLSLEPSGNPEVGISFEGNSSVLSSLKSSVNFVELAVERPSRSWLGECMLESKGDLGLADGKTEIEIDREWSVENKIKLKKLCFPAHLIS
jgi:hypothetical protein